MTMADEKLIIVCEPDFVFPDERGLLVQISHDKYRQTNAVFTKKGAVRGRGHYHKNTDEAFFVLQGSVRVYASRGEQEEEAVFRTGDMFVIPANVRHSMDYLEDTYLVVEYTVPVELPDGAKDIFE